MKTVNTLVKLMLLGILTAGMMMFTACSSDDDVLNEADGSTAMTQQTAPTDRTVLVYLAGHNDLNKVLELNVAQIKKGSKGMSSGTLLVFVRTLESGKTPWLARIVNGQVRDSVSVKDLGINVNGNYACDPEMMGEVLRYAYSHYPAKEYGLVLGGHSTGWMIEEEPNKKTTRAFGHDTGDNFSQNGKWINVPTMVSLLEKVPHLKFIFADCCNFMCLESMYELRNVTDYIIGSPAEIPGQGAPYEEVVPDFFKSAAFYTSIINKYDAAQRGFLPLSVVKTSEMEQLANATRTALNIVQNKVGNGYAKTEGLIHYNYGNDSDLTFHQEQAVFFDAGDFFLSQLPAEDYRQWKQALDRAVIEKRFAKKWVTCKSWRLFYSDFEMTQEKFHGVSMFVPQNPDGPYSKQYAIYNQDIQQLQWYQAAGWRS